MSSTISVVIPVFNAEEFLPECLDSILSQTLPGIEILCVDDGSVDGSVAVLERYAAAHGNIRVFRQANKGAGAARNLALDNAAGRYVAFMDADDLYPDPDALKFLYDLAESSGCAVAGGYPRLFTAGGDAAADERYTNGWLSRNSYPRLGVIDFREYQSPLGYQRYIFRLDLLDRNGIRFKDLRRFQDPPFCAEALHCAGRLCVSDRVVYKYRRGNHGIDWLGDNGIRARHFMEGRLWILRFARENGYAKLFGMMTEDLHRALPAAAYGLPHVRPVYDEINRFVDSLGLKTVAFVFCDLGQGGIQRVMSYLVPQFVMNWYRVVLLTTNGRGNDVYSVNVPVVRVVIGVDRLPENRACRLRAALVDNHVDFVIFQEYYSPRLLSDVAAARSCGVPYIVHHHNMFSNFFLRHNQGIDELAYYRCFAEASALIVLSHADERYFRAMGCNAHYFPNPISDVPDGFRRTGEGKTVLWMARYTAIKRPVDALKIFELVLQRHPDAKMKMLGGFAGTKEVEAHVKLVRDYLAKKPALAAAVSLEGYQSDIWKYLGEASALLTTAKFEGFPYTLAEAAAAGVPTVGYELPYLELAADNPGFVQTPQCDVAAAADAICRLFEDSSFAAKASASARTAFERVRGFDQMQAYGRLFSGIAAGARATCETGLSEKILRLTVVHGFTGLGEVKNQVDALGESLRQTRAQRDDLKRRLDKAAEDVKAVAKLREAEKKQQDRLSALQRDLEAARRKIGELEAAKRRLSADCSRAQKEVADLHRSEAYRAGMAVTWPARKAWRWIGWLRENGVKRAVKRA